MRSIHDPDLRHQLPRLIDIVFALANQKSGVEYIRTILYYLTRATGKISRAQLEQVLLVQRELGEKTMMTIADEYIQEGIEKGIERGIEKGLEQGLEQGAMLAAKRIARRLLKFHDIVTVSELTRLPLAEVQALAAEPEDPEETEPPTPHLN